MDGKLLTRQLKALANERRLLLLRELKKGRSLSVGTLAKAIHLSIKATSKHLLILMGVGIVESRRRGMSVFYRLSLDQRPPVNQVLQLL